MCLAIPGKVEEITTDGLIRVGRVNFGGVVKSVCLDYVPEVEVGDYTIVHVGFAISKIDEETAEQTLRDFKELGLLDEELALSTDNDDARGRAKLLSIDMGLRDGYNFLYDFYASLAPLLIPTMTSE